MPRLSMYSVALCFVACICGCFDAAPPKPAKGTTTPGPMPISTGTKTPQKTETPVASEPKVAWEIKTGLDAPESVYFDKDSGFLFLSQIVGAGDAEDGKGLISKLDANGKMIANEWITGLNAPKGIRSHGGRLWVSDLKELVGIDIKEGMIVERIKPAGAEFLNDVECGPDGTVYVADTLGSRIFAVKDGQASVFAQGDDLESPNGLLVDGDSLVVAAWGRISSLSEEQKTPGRLFKLDLATKKKTLITEMPTGNLDGLESDGQGGYYVTDWKAGKVMHIDSAGTVKVLATTNPGTADHAWIADKKLLIVPLMMDNTLRAYDLSGE